MDSVWLLLERIAVVVTLLGLPYLVVSNRRRVPRFSFSFTGGQREFFDRDNLEFCRFTFRGTVRNQSLDENSIERIYLVVWRKGKKGTRRFGLGAVVEEGGVQVGEPLHFSGRQSRRLEIRFEVPLTGSGEAQLTTATVPIGTSGNVQFPKYEYELAFEDVLGNLFDRDGLPRNRRGIDLRWTLDNTFEKLRDGNPFPLLWHLLRIVVTDVVFFFKRQIRRFGL
jgi:hypothetical protein